MDRLTNLLLEKGYITIDQLILLNLGRNSKKSQTIDKLRKDLEIPRSTLVDHLNKLENDGLILIRRQNKEKEIFPVPEVSEKVIELIEDFVIAYRNVIVHASKMKTRQLESMQAEK